MSKCIFILTKEATFFRVIDLSSVKISKVTNLFKLSLNKVVKIEKKISSVLSFKKAPY